MTWFDRQYNQDYTNGDMLIMSIKELNETLQQLVSITTKQCQKEKNKID